MALAVRSVGAFLALAGILLVVLTSLGASGFHPAAIPFAIWAAAPYVLLWAADRWIANRWVVGGAGAAAIAAEIGIRAAVFVWPRGSTAALALIFSPVYLAALVMPAGAALGWGAGAMWRRRLARPLIVLAAPAVLGLTILGFARPDLFPTTVMKRRALQGRIGPPRIVTDAGGFQAVPLTKRPGWMLAEPLDERPGDEIALVDHEGADIVDSTTFGLVRRLAFPAPPGRLWTSFSTLVRLPDGELAVADTGGGFSRTLLKNLDGAERWEYRPDADLAPTALRPADLDGDGVVEFYAASGRFVTRLDPKGREVWRRAATLPSIVALLPRTDRAPAWVVGLEYGRKTVVWDEHGDVLLERPAPAADTPVTAIDSYAGRVIVHGGTTARGFAGATGRASFEVPLGEFTLSQAIGVRQPTGEIAVALVGATDRETGRWRLLVTGPGGRTLYDEIADRPLTVLGARRADGGDTLLVRSDSGIRAFGAVGRTRIALIESDALAGLVPGPDANFASLAFPAWPAWPE